MQIIYKYRRHILRWLKPGLALPCCGGKISWSLGRSARHPNTPPPGAYVIFWKYQGNLSGWPPVRFPVALFPRPLYNPTSKPFRHVREAYRALQVIIVILDGH